MTQARFSKTRLFFIFFFFLAALLALFIRLGFLQIFKSSKYLSIARTQSRAVIEMQPARGKILDSKGRELALDVRLDSLYAVSREIKNKLSTATQIQKAMPGIDRSKLTAQLHKDKLFVWIARKIDETKSAALKKMKIKGLGFIKESQRVYPKADLGCHLVGFTDIDNNGIEGIELFYNSFLKGVPGWRMIQKDAKQRELVSKEIEMMPPVDGYNVHLTIDQVIQSIAQKELAYTCEKFNALGGSATVIDPKTGDVLAMATYPVYDLNKPGKSDAETRRNRAVTDIIEPGSVFKAITLASILENKIFGLEEKFDCEHGSWAVAGKVLHDHHGSGVLTFREVIEKSSNIGTVKGAMRLGGDKLYKTIRDFGFGQKTGIGLAGEVNGIVPAPKNWSRSSIINIPIGQGVAVTPVQLAYALGAIANNGTLMKPRIVTRIEDQDGNIIKSYDPQPVRQVVSKETSLLVRSVLQGVVERGTGKKASVPGFKSAGKTGTAQKILPTGGYSHDFFIASFVGFVPYDEPKLVITVSIDEPHPVIFGGDVAAPCFSKIAAQTLDYWRVAKTVAPPEVSKTKSQTAPTKKKSSSKKKKSVSAPLSAPATTAAKPVAVQ